MGIYATAVELRGELGLEADDTDGLSDLEAERILKAAERRLDRIAGPLVTRANGRKYDPATLADVHRNAVRDATVIIAAAARRDAQEPRAVKREQGPDFTVDYADAPTPALDDAVREAAAELDRFGLRALTATAR